MVWVLSLSVTKLIPRRLTPVQYLSGIYGLSGFGTAVTALAQSVPYPQETSHEAVPKNISGSTSYCRV